MNIMLVQAFDYAKIPHIALSEIAFSAGLPGNEITNARKFIFPYGYCYRGYRQFPTYLKSFDISRNRKILLIRDPRDILVSEYFSTAYSHELPANGLVREEMLKLRNFARAIGVDKYCLSQVEVYQRNFENYRALLDGEIRVYRYEDVVFEKSKWLADMLSYFEVIIPPAVVENIAAAHDLRPERENPAEHVRQVKPANFRLHLKPETVEILNREFKIELKRHGYDT